MSKKVIISKKLKRQQEKNLIRGTKWTESDDYIIRIYELYKKDRITADHLLDIFKGRTMHAINMKVYNIRGKRGDRRKPLNTDPRQLQFPFGGQITDGK